MYSIYLLISADVCLLQALQLRGNLSLKQLEKRILCVKLYGCLSCQDCLRMGDYSTFQSWNGLIEHSFALVLHRFKYTKSPVLRACQRLSLLTSFEETRGIVLVRTALSVGCIQQRKALSTLRGRERGERGASGDACSS